eukprot:CAMPEP_0175131792 /NCGR_PEP_ID=MMETSP0087-20121206/6735_1 /TAXON_ID=136419 /ORGANISM="Unknown Unknown, Strain D1" /LENGTH=90 /DNA_ID=CAMNT_0016414113 /DNA_START=212 /DNA_END=484 /DNA_ORIENTATION=-
MAWARQCMVKEDHHIEDVWSMMCKLYPEPVVEIDSSFEYHEKLQGTISRIVEDAARFSAAETIAEEDSPAESDEEKEDSNSQQQPLKLHR